MKLILTDKPISFSLSHTDSDFLDNAIVMEQVVGTLVKYGDTGSYEPFLAESWNSSEDGLVWHFKLRPNLIADDGSTIDADSIVSNFKFILKIYSKKYSPPTFNQLTGWSEFALGDDSKLGIERVNDLTLKFVFNSPPSGLLEFLSMPYYGFYSKLDFNDLHWKNKHKITASGAYRIEKISEFDVQLVKRTEWPYHKPNTPQKIEITFDNIQNAISSPENIQGATIISIRNKPKDTNLPFTLIEGTPTVLTSFVLSPYLSPFENQKIRIAFKTVIRNILEKKDFPKTNGVSNYFYPNFSKYDLSKMELDDAVTELRKLGKKEISTFLSKLPDESQITYIKNILSEVTNLTGVSFQYSNPETEGADWFKKIRTNRSFSLRVARVDIGGSPENWVIDMMFCSNLGISFPDPNNSIRKVVQKYKKEAVFNREDYSKAIHDIIESETFVIPIIHSGFSWMISKQIDLKNIPQTMNIPRFDLIELKNDP